MPELEKLAELYDDCEGASFRGEVIAKDYVTKILQFIIQDSKQKDTIKVKKELELRYDGFKTVKPDIVLVNKRDNQGLDQALSSVPILLIEVKNLDDSKA